ncbi:HTH domain-containing protein [Monaibacterium marinum]|uniref:HTH domain-containing protein n=1 Tax=Pontivivens marinum TaxID=1690039 RepID=A0A2C9CP78_9RHOB|nr:YafY family protein [Monaibacterium marinum]SOH92995.1 HTH domain-containing protein [Monaibacterium marinum]
MRRADRLFQIVQYLRGGRLITAKTLAERLEVSERTIYRDIADLIGSGVPVEGEAGVGYLMREGYDLPPLMFTRDELHALVAGIRMARAFGGASLALAAEDALSKIESAVPDAPNIDANAVPIYAIGGGETTSLARPLLDQIQSACNSHTRLHFAYRDKDGQASTRIIRPLGLWFWGQVWTLVAWCELRHDYRMFRVDRIADLTLGAPFTETEETSLRTFFAMRHHQR